MNKWKLAVAFAAVAAIAGGGAALAARHFDSANSESQAIINDAANQLGVQPAQLSDALKKALENRVDAAVAAGAITKDEGDHLKQAIESGDVPLVGFPFLSHGDFAGPRHFGALRAAGTFLGLSDSELRSRLDSGKTLAQIAKDEGKSVDDLIQALLNDAKQHLDQAVAAGRLTQDQEQSILGDLKDRITALVNGERPQFRGFRPFGDDDSDLPGA
jgi:hypothetical protein